jgi:hypothetical protein
VLPSELSVLAENLAGEPVSLLLALQRNSRDQLDVRVAEGAQMFDGRRVWSFEATETQLDVVDRMSGERRRLASRRPPRLLAVVAQRAWLEEPGGPVACDLRTGACAPRALPELPLAHTGPGRGFAVSLDRGTLRVRLPQDESDGVALATGLSRLIGVFWARAGGAEEAVVHRTFRGRARVHALPHPVTPDGVLDEWSNAAPLVVEAPWQLQAGGEGWRGERDGSFSVAAAWTADSRCFAGRVRDDHLGPGDTLTLSVANALRTLPLTDAAPPGASLGRELFGASFEVCFPTRELPARGTHPFAATFTDVDPGEATTLLSSAPTDVGVPLGELVLDAPT